MKHRMSSLASLALSALRTPRAMSAAGPYKVTRTRAEWHAMLSDMQFNVMRKHATEPPGSSSLDRTYSNGTYHCRGCDVALYSSAHKYDSGTGWPSFFAVLPDAIQTKRDLSFFSVRMECHCDRCGSHLGHIFNDGPAPTGRRHCLNGVSLVFRPA